MSFEAILLPMFVQVALTFLLLFWTIILRLRAVRRGEVSLHQIALREANWPLLTVSKDTFSRGLEGGSE